MDNKRSFIRAAYRTIHAVMDQMDDYEEDFDKLPFEALSDMITELGTAVDQLNDAANAASQEEYEESFVVVDVKTSEEFPKKGIAKAMSFASRLASRTGHVMDIYLRTRGGDYLQRSVKPDGSVRLRV